MKRFDKIYVNEEWFTILASSDNKMLFLLLADKKGNRHYFDLLANAFYIN